MSKQQPNHRPGGQMAAKPYDPWIGVHVLTEFIFCPRAGLLSYEQEKEEQEQQEVARLDYLPQLPTWNLKQIEKRLASELPLLWAAYFFVLLCVGLLWGMYVGKFGTIVVAGVVLAALLLGIRVSLKLRARVKELGRRRRLAQTARPRVPDPISHEKQTVNWWSLLQAGFESIPYKEQLRDERWRIAGKPWRVLRKGSLRIPVFRMKGNNPRLYRQHYARMAAYCHLLKVCEGAESPYGIVLFPNSYDGVTVSNSPASGKAFHSGLLAARAIINDSRNHQSDPAAPERTNLCQSCGCGFPRAYRAGANEITRYGEIVPVFAFLARDQRHYHSQCGDRFRWCPPHQRFHEKRYG